MNDLERVQRMHDYNWKPANQYWRELYEKSQANLTLRIAEIAELKQRIKLLEK